MVNLETKDWKNSNGILLSLAVGLLALLLASKYSDSNNPLWRSS